MTIPELVQKMLNQRGRDPWAFGISLWQHWCEQLAEHIATTDEIACVPDLLARIRELERERDTLKQVAQMMGDNLGCTDNVLQWRGSDYCEKHCRPFCEPECVVAYYTAKAVAIADAESEVEG